MSNHPSFHAIPNIHRPRFHEGFADQQMNFGWSSDYEEWSPNEQLLYERGRLFATLVNDFSASLFLKKRGKPTIDPAMVRRYMAARASRDII